MKRIGALLSLMLCAQAHAQIQTWSFQSAQLYADDGDYAYFVHSYGAQVTEDTLASAEYGSPLAAIVRRGNFWGTQFHPERSGSTGARILQNFLGLDRCS